MKICLNNLIDYIFLYNEGLSIVKMLEIIR